MVHTGLPPRPLARISEALLQSDLCPCAEHMWPDQRAPHRLPALLMWTTTLLTAVGMAVINFFSLLAIESSIASKFSLMQAIMDTGGLAIGLLVLMAVSMAYAAAGACLILCFAPSCGGSGLPECKSYLNGGDMPRLFTARTLLVRIVTSFLANSAGFPVGREGPTVTIGSNLAFLVSHALTMPRFRQRVRLTHRLSAAVVEEERFAYATRINCVVGGACAMAMLFNTPIGGLLYMFEEVSSAVWPVELTFRAFVGTTCCALLSYGLLSMVNREIREFVIFAWLPDNKEWSRTDLPIFVALAATLGAVTALHTRMMLAMAQIRKRLHGRLRRPRLGVALETVTYAALCALLSGLASLLAGCSKQRNQRSPYVRFNCPEGEYNPVASLLVTTSHSSVKLLFSGTNNSEFGWRSSMLAFVVYFALNVGLSGLPVPGGAFTATMLLGGLCGRAAGDLARQAGLDAAVPGVYAVVGAAAMLCGFKQWAAAVVLIVVQCVNDSNVTPVVMLSVSVALAVNRRINERGHDEEQIERKRLPYLEVETPCKLDGLVAGDLLDQLPPEARLQRRASCGQVASALRVTEGGGPGGTSFAHFPVLDGACCVGIITRAHLSAALQACQECCGPSPRDDTGTADPQEIVIRRVSSGMSLWDGASPVAGDAVPLDRIMDPTAFSLMEDTPVPRFYALFARAGERACCVTSKTGEFRGIVSRGGLIHAARQ